MENAISISGLYKSFGRTKALDGLDLQVATGEVHGFLGPNGPGKSTTVRVLLGLLHADSGDVRLLGGDPWKDATALHRRLAYVPRRRQPLAQSFRRGGDRPSGRLRAGSISAAARN
jgi:ABC-2 type transport system ATP-binding protein